MFELREFEFFFSAKYVMDAKNVKRIADGSYQFLIHNNTPISLKKSFIVHLQI